MSPIIHVPLSQLSLSPRNARKTGGGDVADLAANIAASGLLQNLIVTAVAGDAGDRFEVIAGGRRLAALQLLEREGRLPPGILTDGVPCRRIDDDGAIVEASTAENTIRAPLHPADQFTAFQAMVDGGKSIADVAAHFGTSEITVQRRLRLANVAPELFEEYRAGRASLEQITALAITEDHDAQRSAWKRGSDADWLRAPHRLREALTEKQVSSSDYRVRFVGLDAYEAAGGAVVRDLFDDAGGGYVADEKLLDRLVDEKLQAAVEEVKAEGWSFVRVDDDDNAWKFRNDCSESRPTTSPRTLTPEEAAHLEELRTKEADRRALLARIENGDEEVGDWEEVSDALHELEREIAQLEAPIATWSDRQKTKAGCQVVLDKHSGRLKIHRGLIPASSKSEHQAAQASAAADGKPLPPKTPELSEAMIRRLTAHKTIALQAGLIAKADVALAVLAHALLAGVWHHKSSSSGSYAVHVDAKQELDQLDKYQFNDVTNSPHYQRNRQALDELRSTLRVPDREAALLPWLLQQNRDVVVSLLAAVSAYTVTAGDHASDKLLEALDIDMADYWSPTAETFFNHVPKPLGVLAVREGLGKDPRAEQLATAPMKKDEFAGQAEQMLQRRGWLPKPLRRPGYRLRTEGGDAAAAKAEKPASPKKAAKAPAKKSAAKAASSKKPIAKKPAAKKPAAKKATAKSKSARK